MLVRYKSLTSCEVTTAVSVLWQYFAFRHTIKNFIIVLVIYHGIISSRIGHSQIYSAASSLTLFMREQIIYDVVTQHIFWV